MQDLPSHCITVFLGFHKTPMHSLNVALFDWCFFRGAEYIFNNLSVKSKFTLISHVISSEYGIKIYKDFLILIRVIFLNNYHSLLNEPY